VLIARIGAKLLSNWHVHDESTLETRARSFVALMTGVVSLSMGVLGGYIAKCACIPN
jgi:hypothetical protein